MSYEKVKSIKFDKSKKEVYITSAANNVIPLHFTQWECTMLSKIWQSEGYDTMLEYLLDDIVDGNLQFYSGKFKDFKNYIWRTDVAREYPELSWDWIKDQMKELGVLGYYDWKQANPSKKDDDWYDSPEFKRHDTEYKRLSEQRRHKIYECFKQFLSTKGSPRVPTSLDDFLTYISMGGKIKYLGETMSVFYNSFTDTLCKKKRANSRCGYALIKGFREHFTEYQNKITLV